MKEYLDVELTFHQLLPSFARMKHRFFGVCEKREEEKEVEKGIRK